MNFSPHECSPRVFAFHRSRSTRGSYFPPCISRPSNDNERRSNRFQVMCVQYWPASKDKDEEYGGIGVSVLKEEELANFHIRTIRLYKKNENDVSVLSAVSPFADSCARREKLTGKKTNLLYSACKTGRDPGERSKETFAFQTRVRYIYLCVYMCKKFIFERRNRYRWFETGVADFSSRTESFSIVWYYVKLL